MDPGLGYFKVELDYKAWLWGKAQQAFMEFLGVYAEYVYTHAYHQNIWNPEGRTVSWSLL